MTEVVTTTAAYLQPTPPALKPRAPGADSAPSQNPEAVVVAAGNAPQPSDSIQNAASSSFQGNGFAPNSGFLGHLLASVAGTDFGQSSPTTAALSSGDSGTSGDSNDASSVASVATPASFTATAPPPAVTSHPAGSAEGGSPAPQASVNQPSDGALPLAANVPATETDQIADKIIGAAFAPRSIGVSNSLVKSYLPPRDFIFGHGSIFAANVALSAPPAESSPNPSVIAQSPTASSPASEGSAASTQTAASQTDSANPAAASATTDSGPSGTSAQHVLYQRAQAVAAAFSDRSSNPAVQSLMATLESYAAMLGSANGGTPAAPTVRVIA